MKEHETEFHGNTNYVTVFALRHAQMALQPRSRDDEFITIEEEKDLEEDSANFTIAIGHWSRAISYTASNNEILLF